MARVAALPPASRPAAWWGFKRGAAIGIAAGAGVLAGCGRRQKMGKKLLLFQKPPDTTFKWCQGLKIVATRSSANLIPASAPLKNSAGSRSLPGVVHARLRRDSAGGNLLWLIGELHGIFRDNDSRQHA